MLGGLEGRTKNGCQIIEIGTVYTIQCEVEAHTQYMVRSTMMVGVLHSVFTPSSLDSSSDIY